MIYQRTSGSRPLSALLLAALLCSGCGAPGRDNPLGPANREGASLTLAIPLPKYLADVVQRVVARLEGPGMQPLVKELDHPPLGPATGTIGAIPPGIGRILTIEGFDLAGELLFRGEKRDIAIVAGDTTRVELDLVLVKAPPAVG
ncbi:MAG: hypothetical protein HYW07_00040 [Candidatus Latescibacteria bacterium]|nr:hypothetical protein [Candidatus Latescibacterota bacterium]